MNKSVYGKSVLICGLAVALVLGLAGGAGAWTGTLIANMTGSTTDPTTNIKFINSATGYEYESHPVGTMILGHSFTVASEAYTLDKIWIRGGEFFGGPATAMSLELYEMASATGTYTEVSGNLFTGPSTSVSCGASTTPQWISFDVDDVALKAHTAYAFRFGGQTCLFDWRCGTADATIAAVDWVPNTYYYTAEDFAFAIEAIPLPTTFAIVTLGGLVWIRRKKKK